MTEKALDLSSEATEVVADWRREDEAALERWSKSDVSDERRTIWNVYNQAMTLSSQLKKLLNSDNITEEEKELVRKVEADLFWQGVKLSAIFPGAVEASEQLIP